MQPNVGGRQRTTTYEALPLKVCCEPTDDIGPLRRHQYLLRRLIEAKFAVHADSRALKKNDAGLNTETDI